MKLVILIKVDKMDTDINEIIALYRKNRGFLTLNQPSIIQLASDNFDTAPAVMNLFQVIITHL